jgi:hypothetical protein
MDTRIMEPAMEFSMRNPESHLIGLFDLIPRGLLRGVKPSAGQRKLDDANDPYGSNNSTIAE